MKTPQKQKAPTRRDRTFHHQRPEFVEHSFARHLAAGTITEDDIAVIREWIDEIAANRHISVSRANKIAFNMVTWRRFIGPFRTNTIKDLQHGVRTLHTATGGRRLFDKDMPADVGQDGSTRTAEQPNGRPYKRNTIHDMIGLLKRFYLWMAENDYSTITAKGIRAIKTPPKDKMTKTVDSIVTAEDAEAIIRVCESPRDRALFGMLWDGGFRAVEVGTLTWGQVKFDQYGVAVNVDAKTEFPRYVRLTGSSAYLAQWRDSYPCTISDDAMVFLTRQRRPVTYDVLAVQLGKLTRKAGLSKRLTLHGFRHGRITDLTRRGVHESIVKKMMWGNAGTKMLSVYSHLTDADIDDAMLANAGIRPRENTGPGAMDARQCRNCLTVNAPTAELCWRCGTPLTEEFASSLEELRREIEKTVEYRSALEAAVNSLSDTRA